MHDRSLVLTMMVMLCYYEHLVAEVVDQRAHGNMVPDRHNLHRLWVQVTHPMVLDQSYDDSTISEMDMLHLYDEVCTTRL